MENLNHLQEDLNATASREEAQSTEEEAQEESPKKVRLKKCPRCGKKQGLENFAKHDTSSDGYQSYCKQCKSNMHKRKRKKNITFRIKHHFATRIKDQLGNACPQHLSRDLEEYLGYRISKLRSHLGEELQLREGITVREAFERGYHIDHVRPLSSFHCAEVDSEAGLELFRECWAITNLVLISAEENLAKGAKYSGSEETSREAVRI